VTISGRLSPFRSPTAICAGDSATCRIYERLGQFAKASVPAQDAEWVNAEKRLDNWMGGFLLSRAAESPKPVAEPARVLRWRAGAKTAFSWRWAVCAAAFVALAVAGLLVAKRGWVALTPVQVATHQAPPQVENLAPVPTTAQTPDAAPGTTKPVEPTLKVVPGTKNASPTVPQKSTEPRGQAQPEIGLTRPPSVSNGNRPSQIAQDYTPQDLSPNDRLQVGAKATFSTPSRPASMERAAESAQPSTPRLPATKGATVSTPADHPALLRLEPGTRLWIRVVSISRQPDGSFTFRGSLLEPVSHVGGVLLDQGAELTGSGSVKDGKVAVFIRDVTIRGVSYVLQGATGTLSEQMPGAGKALEFDNGQVLEMWLSSATVYEKTANANSFDQPKP
jgi:hypothetical protein